MIDFKAMREKIKQVHRLNRAVQRIYDKATGTTITITDMPKAGGVGNKLQNDVVELVTVKEEYETAKQELDEMKSQLMAKMKKKPYQTQPKKLMMTMQLLILAKLTLFMKNQCILLKSKK